MRLLIKMLFIYQFIVGYNSFSQTLNINENSKLITVKNDDNSVFVGKIDGINKKGILTFSNGDIQIGYWKKDTLNGFGIKKYFDGKIEQGVWRRGLLKTNYDSLEFYDDGGIKTAVKEKNNGNWECRYFLPNQKEKSIKYYENSKLKYERFWSDNNKGFKKEVNYGEFGKMNGLYITYQEPIIDTDGKGTVPYDTIGKYVNGKRDGEWMKKYKGTSNLNMSEFIYQDGNLTYEVEYIYFEDKNLKSKETLYKEGSKLKTIEFDTNGVVKYVMDYEGDYTIHHHFFKNGKLSDSERTSNKTLRKEGFSYGYFNNGALKNKDFYKEDILVYYERYFENGRMEKFENHLKSEKYNENGVMIFYLDKIKMNGFVIYEYGEKWVGEIRDGEKTIGKGTYYYNGGDKYNGTFNSDENIADGPGEYHWQNGDKYIGNFKDGKINGYGKVTYSSGSIAEGIWENEELVEDYHKNNNAKNKSEATSKTNSVNPALLIALKAADDYIKNPEPFKSNSTSNSSASKSTKSNNSVKGSKPCSNCNKVIKKPYLLDRCKTEWRNESKPGYVKCGSCEGYGFRTTNVGCDCPNGIGYCFKENCSVSSCKNGWIGCSSCNRTGQSR